METQFLLFWNTFHFNFLWMTVGIKFQNILADFDKRRYYLEFSYETIYIQRLIVYENKRNDSEHQQQFKSRSFEILNLLQLCSFIFLQTYLIHICSRWAYILVLLLSYCPIINIFMFWCVCMYVHMFRTDNIWFLNQHTLFAWCILENKLKHINFNLQFCS